jgi:hypothetical protein
MVLLEPLALHGLVISPSHLCHHPGILLCDQAQPDSGAIPNLTGVSCIQGSPFRDPVGRDMEAQPRHAFAMHRSDFAYVTPDMRDGGIVGLGRTAHRKVPSNRRIAAARMAAGQTIRDPQRRSTYVSEPRQGPLHLH